MRMRRTSSRIVATLLLMLASMGNTGSSFISETDPLGEDQTYTYHLGVRIRGIDTNASHLIA